MAAKSMPLASALFPQTFDEPKDYVSDGDSDGQSCHSTHSYAIAS
jgi:hypothetical protein